MSKITLVLEKDGVRQTYEFSTKIKSLIHAGKDIQRFMRENWQLIDCYGKNKVMVNHIKNQIESYNKKPEDYKVPIKETLTVTKDVTGASAKQIVSAGRKVVKEKVLGRFRRKKNEGD